MSHEQQILRERAKILAIPPESSNRKAVFDLILFRVGAEKYGIENIFVREACEVNSYASIPCTPPWIAGVMNRRGRIIALLNLVKLFSLPDASSENSAVAIVIGDKEFECAILADELLGQRILYRDEIQDTEHRAAQQAPPKWLKCITNDGLIVLDYEKISTDDSIIIEDTLSEEII